MADRHSREPERTPCRAGGRTGIAVIRGLVLAAWGLAAGAEPPPIEPADPDRQTAEAAAPSAEPEAPLSAVGGPEWQRFIDQTIEEIRARTTDEDMNKETADQIEDGIRALDQIAQGVARFAEAVGASFQSEEFKAFTERMEQDFKTASDSLKDVDWQGLEDMVRAMAEEMAAPFAVMADNLERAAGGAETVALTREIEPFHALDINGSFIVNVTIGPVTRLEIAARANAHELIQTQVEDGTLLVHPLRTGVVRGPITLTLTTPNLDKVAVSGANQIEISGLEAAGLTIKITGTSNVTLRGAVDDFAATLSGASNLHAGDLAARSVDVSCAGACNAAVHAGESLRAAVTGASSVAYRGDPSKVNTEIRGVGSVRREQSGG